MGFTVPRRILLIGLLLYCTGEVVQTVNPRTLMNIVKNLENRLSGMGQYAMAFRITRANCEDSKYGGKELITPQLIDKLKSNVVYVSDNLIAARADKNIYDHSEYRLRDYLKNVLSKTDECVVYFTVNSPCLDKCLSDRPEVSIRSNLQDLQNYNGIKAFAFKKIWEHDKREEVIKRLKEIAPKVPYYLCEKNKPESECL